MNQNIVLLTPPSRSHRTSEESLGIGYLAAVLRQLGNNVSIIDGWLLNLTIAEMVAKMSSMGDIFLIGISCYFSSIDDVHTLIQSIRDARIVSPIVAGGYGPTFHPVEFLSAGANFVLRGEAELSLVELVTSLEQPGGSHVRVPGLSFKDARGTISHNPAAMAESNLNAIPFPTRDSITETIRQRNPVHISTSRGCFAHCLFCSVIAFDRETKQESRWRGRSISSIVEEIRQLHEQFGVTCFKFVDDSFIEPPRDAHWTQSFSEELARRNLQIRFRTQVRADRLTPELVSALVSAGWFATSVGVENGSPSALKRMNKSATMEHNRNALALLKENGVYVQMGMILFDHMTSLHELQENYRFLQSLAWPVTKGIFTEMYAAQGTPFTRLLSNKGLITNVRNGNAAYVHGDTTVSYVYQCLKQWHKSHAQVYDHAINPISAPKVLTPEGYRQYHAVCLQLLKLDLHFFGQTLDLVVANPDNLPKDFTAQQIAMHQQHYTQVADRLSELDSTHGIAYTGDVNKFLV